MIKPGGFTLVEMLVVMVIAAILAGLAWPAYREQVLKTRRSTGVAVLVELAARLEHYYADHGTYAGATLGANAGDLFLATTANGYYRLLIGKQDDLYFSISAAPTARGHQDRDRCGTFTLDSLGNRGLSGNSAGMRQCWR